MRFLIHGHCPFILKKCPISECIKNLEYLTVNLDGFNPELNKILITWKKCVTRKKERERGREWATLEPHTTLGSLCPGCCSLGMAWIFNWNAFYSIVNNITVMVIMIVIMVIMIVIVMIIAIMIIMITIIIITLIWA